MRRIKTIIVDGAIIAHLDCAKGEKPRVSNPVAVRRALEEQRYRIIILVDASLQHEVDNPAPLEGMIDNQAVCQVPAGTEVLETAEALKALVLSDDRLQTYQGKYDWPAKRRVPVMIMNGDLFLYEPRLEPKNIGSPLLPKD